MTSQGLCRTQLRPIVWETLEMFVSSLSCSLLSCRQMAKAIVYFHKVCDRVTVKLGTCSISGYVWSHDLVMQTVHSISHEAYSIQMLLTLVLPLEKMLLFPLSPALELWTIWVSEVLLVT